jgi:hypothetical protein
MSKVILYKPGLKDGSENELANIGMGILARGITDYGDKILFTRDDHFKKEVAVTPMAWGSQLVDVLALSLVSQEWHLEQLQHYIDLYHQHGVKIVVGGPHAFSYWEFLEKDPRIWKVAVGEVDGQWGKVVESEKKVVFLEKPTHLTTPDYSSFAGKEGMTAYPLYTSRGCTNRCNFCVGSKNHGKFRVRNLDEIFEELSSIEKLYPNVKRIYVVDDCFSGDQIHARFFLGRFLTLGYAQKYQLTIINVRADQIDMELLTLMRNCGVTMLPIGVESADPEVFKHVGKGETLEHIEWAIHMIQMAKITPWLNMIVGLPHDNPDKHRNSVEWCVNIPKPRIVHWFQMAPFRKTRAYDYFLQQGCFEDGFIPSPYGRRYDELPWESDFETEDFGREGRMVAQLEAYLRCHSPILVNNLDRIRDLCRKHRMTRLLREWENNAPIDEYVQNNLPDKQRKGQVT